MQITAADWKYLDKKVITYTAIAKKYGITTRRVKKLLATFDITTFSFVRTIPYDILYDMYLAKNMTAQEICIALGIYIGNMEMLKSRLQYLNLKKKNHWIDTSKNAIAAIYYCKDKKLAKDLATMKTQYGDSIRTYHNGTIREYKAKYKLPCKFRKIVITEEKMKEFLLSGKTLYDICRYMYPIYANADAAYLVTRLPFYTILRYAKKYNIPDIYCNMTEYEKEIIDREIEKLTELLDKEELEKLYIGKKLRIKDIAAICKISEMYIDTLLYIYDIPVRKNRLIDLERG